MGGGSWAGLDDAPVGQVLPNDRNNLDDLLRVLQPLAAECGSKADSVSRSHSKRVLPYRLNSTAWARTSA